MRAQPSWITYSMPECKVQLSLLFKYSEYYCVLISIKTAVSMYFTGPEIMDDRGELANITKNQEGRRI